jgi:23S rRNA (adenine2503-C2)-methyltransferase
VNLPGPQINSDSIIDPLGLTSDQACAAVAAREGSASNALEAYRKLFREGKLPVPLPANVPITFTPPAVDRVMREDSPEGEVIKFTCKVRGLGNEGKGGSLKDGPLETESVLIPMASSGGRRTYTLCVSSQVGCAMGCDFCETAQMGLVRSLVPAEIVGQWFAATHIVGVRPKNVVFMGMGEPLDNFDNVIQAIATLKDHNGASVAISNITVSTVGKLDGLRRLREQIQLPTWHRLSLAISLNAPNDDVRSKLMPVNKRWKIAELQQELIDWPRFGGNKFCIEYVLIPGVNDQREHAAQIADFVRPLKSLVREGASGDTGRDTRERAVINVIPYNPRRNSPWPAPTEERVSEFINWLIEERVFVKRRRTKGRDMMGACGQLGNEQIRARQLVSLTSGMRPVSDQPLQ